ncbi:MAG: hypothetical protein ACI8YO_002478 [Gammaproteobacteria bacterium]|jgi:hypothetical protein
MFKSLVVVSLILFSIALFSQNKPIYVYDYETGILDSLPIIEFDTLLTSGVTEFHIGDYNSDVADLSLIAPTEGVYPGGNFTLKRRIEDSYTLQDYPIRTSLKISSVLDGEVSSRCSGSMISKRHVLSSAHCYVDNENNVFENDILSVNPIYNNGEIDAVFGSTLVSKIYFTKDWNFQGDDFAILELAEPTGLETGWVSVGFNDNTEELFDGIFYKYSYPNVTLIPIDTNEYNGDTLYFNYGILDFESTYSIGVSGAVAVPGESGSSIIKVSETTEYTSYGVLSFSSNLSHQRFTNNSFHAIQNIISDDIILGLAGGPEKKYAIWPNPAVNEINIQGIELKDFISLKVFDSFGKMIFVNTRGSDSKLTIETRGLRSGMYFLHLETSIGAITDKFVKL